MLPAVILFAAVWAAVPVVMQAYDGSVGRTATFLVLPVSCLVAGAVYGLRLGERWIVGTAWRVAAGVVFPLSALEAWQRWEQLREQRRAAASGELHFQLCALDCTEESWFVMVLVIWGFAAVAVVLALFSGAAARLVARVWRTGRT
jgi:hypothetical protein